MNNSRAPQEDPQKSPEGVVCIAFRFASCLAAALFLHGCSTTQPGIASAPPESTTLAATTSPMSMRVDISPSGKEEQPIKPVSEENNIFFSSRSTTVDDAGKEKLRRHADRLKLNPVETVFLVGYTDEQGSRNYNLAITGERLVVVEKLLKSYRVPARQIRSKRIGSSKKLTKCSSADCRQRMRRVELVFSRL